MEAEGDLLTCDFRLITTHPTYDLCRLCASFGANLKEAGVYCKFATVYCLRNTDHIFMEANNGHLDW